jgi:hypothetical protein
MEETENKNIIVYSYDDVPTLKRFAESKARVRGVRGVIGSGKSSAMVWELVRLGLQQQPSPVDGVRRTRWFIVRNSYRQLKDSTIRTVFHWLPEKLFGHYNRTDKNYLITKFKDTEIEFCFRALDDEDDIGNLLSVEMTGAWINEAREVPKGIIDLIDSRIPRYPSMRDGGATRYGIIMDTNAPDEDSWWHEIFDGEKPPPEGWEQFIQPSALSPESENVKNLQPGYYENMLHGKDADFVKVYLENQYGFVREGEPVFGATWVDHLHMAKEEIGFLRGFDLVIGFDFGLTPACAITQFNPLGNFNILDELVSEEMGVERFIKNKLKPLLIQKYRDAKVIIIGDPNAVKVRSQVDERTCFQVLSKEGWYVQLASSNSPTARIDAINFFLQDLKEYGKPALQCSPTCKTIRRAFNAGYVKDKRGIPKKNRYSHIMEALSYAALYYRNLMEKMSRRQSLNKKKSTYIVPSIGGY